QRDADRDLAGQPRGGVSLGRHDVRLVGQQQDVVEGQAEGSEDLGRIHRDVRTFRWQPSGCPRVYRRPSSPPSPCPPESDASPPVPPPSCPPPSPQPACGPEPPHWRRSRSRELRSEKRRSGALRS